MQRIQHCFFVLLLFASADFSAAKSVDQKATVESMRITSDIQSRFASTNVVVQLRNTQPKEDEIDFDFYLPENAFISGFSMTVNDVTTFGKVLKKSEANRLYNTAREKGDYAGITNKNQRDTNIFTSKVSLPAGGKATFNLTYQEVLERIDGLYKHVINKVEFIEIHVLLSEQRAITKFHVPVFSDKIGQLSNSVLINLPAESHVFTAESDAASAEYDDRYVQFVPTDHNLRNGQLLILYDVDRSDPQGEIVMHGGYFYQFFAPNDLPTGSKHICFVLDKSGSMLGRKLQQVKDAMKVILGELSSDDHFSMVMFDHEIEQRAPVAASQRNVERAIDYVDNIKASGATNLHGAILAGLKMLGEDASNDEVFAKMMVFLTDGKPTNGRVTDTPGILRDVAEANGQSFSLHGISLGEDADEVLTQRIASQHHGIARTVYESADTDLQLKCSELVVVGKVKTAGAFDVQLTGQWVKGGKVDQLVRTMRSISFPPSLPPICITRPPPSDPRIRTLPWPLCPPYPSPLPAPTPAPPAAANQLGGFIERMWAYKSIQKQQRQKRWSECSGSCQALEDDTVAKALKYGFVTDATSMVVKPGGRGNDQPIVIAERELIKSSTRPSWSRVTTFSSRPSGGLAPIFGGGGGGGGGSAGGSRFRGSFAGPARRGGGGSPGGSRFIGSFGGQVVLAPAPAQFELVAASAPAKFDLFDTSAEEDASSSASGEQQKLTLCITELVLVLNDFTSPSADKLQALGTISADAYVVVALRGRELVQLGGRSASWTRTLTVMQAPQTTANAPTLPGDFFVTSDADVTRNIVLLTDSNSAVSAGLTSQLKAARALTGARVLAVHNGAGRFDRAKRTTLLDVTGDSSLVVDGPISRTDLSRLTESC